MALCKIKSKQMQQKFKQKNSTYKCNKLGVFFLYKTISPSDFLSNKFRLELLKWQKKE